MAPLDFAALPPRPLRPLLGALDAQAPVTPDRGPNGRYTAYSGFRALAELTMNADSSPDHGTHETPGGAIRDIRAARLAKAARAAGAGDPVASSDELARALAAADAAPAVRAQKVARLREAIARGEYNPSPEDVARSLLEHGLDD